MKFHFESYGVVILRSAKFRISTTDHGTYFRLQQGFEILQRLCDHLRKIFNFVGVTSGVDNRQKVAGTLHGEEDTSNGVTRDLWTNRQPPRWLAFPLPQL